MYILGSEKHITHIHVAPIHIVSEETGNVGQVGVFSKSWEKLRDLAEVLNASLLEITDMLDGKGLLAQQFTQQRVRVCMSFDITFYFK